MKAITPTESSSVFDWLENRVEAFLKDEKSLTRENVQASSNSLEDSDEHQLETMKLPESRFRENG